MLNFTQVDVSLGSSDYYILSTTSLYCGQMLTKCLCRQLFPSAAGPWCATSNQKTNNIFLKLQVRCVVAWLPFPNLLPCFWFLMLLTFVGNTFIIFLYKKLERTKSKVGSFITFLGFLNLKILVLLPKKTIHSRMRKKYFLQSFTSQICLLLSPALICLAFFYFLPFQFSPQNNVYPLIADYLLSKSTFSSGETQIF